MMNLFCSSFSILNVSLNNSFSNNRFLHIKQNIYIYSCVVLMITLICDIFFNLRNINLSYDISCSIWYVFFTNNKNHLKPIKTPLGVITNRFMASGCIIHVRSNHGPIFRHILCNIFNILLSIFAGMRHMEINKKSGFVDQFLPISILNDIHGVEMRSVISHRRPKFWV